MEKADLPLRAAEGIFFYMAGVVVLTLLAAVVFRSVFGTLAALIILAVAPPAILQLLAGQRKKKFELLWRYWKHKLPRGEEVRAKEFKSRNAAPRHHIHHTTLNFQFTTPAVRLLHPPREPRYKRSGC